MNIRSIHVTPLIVFALALGGCAASADSAGSDEPLGAAQAPLSDSKCPRGVPAILAPPADQRLACVLHAEGVQIYECTATGWTFVAPEADLLDPGGGVVGQHYVGPTWEGADGSSVVATKKAAANAPVAGAIPWLLLGAVSHGTTTGKMSSVTSVQRLSTMGGVAPADGCDASQLGAVAKVPYTADYFFYRAGRVGGDNARCGG